MELIETRIELLKRIKIDKHADDRGYFVRTFCADKIKKLTGEIQVVNVNESLSEKKGTFRGFHAQSGGNSETKIIRCVQGAVLNIILDIRQNSNTFGEIEILELVEGDNYLNMIPPGFANSIVTLNDNSKITYYVDRPYSPEGEICINFESYFMSPELLNLIDKVSEKDRNSVKVKDKSELLDILRSRKYSYRE
jgi:dTDP-4-dehydrorhamnose 3,5-epimerase